MHYKCAKCKGDFPSKEVQVDHKSPVVGVGGFKDWDTYIDRLYCEADNLQVLCLTCHKEKTKLERQKAKERKNAEQSK